jgi:hypothetical protein
LRRLRALMTNPSPMTNVVQCFQIIDVPISVGMRCSTRPARPSSPLTRRWREPDSNPRSPGYGKLGASGPGLERGLASSLRMADYLGRQK